MTKLPVKISNYIKQNFREDYLIEVKPILGKKHNTFFKIDITENDVIHHLEFSEKGLVIKHDSEPLFKEDYYEGDFYGQET